MALIIRKSDPVHGCPEALLDTYAIDFETSYTEERSIVPLGARKYLADPETDIYMVSIWGPGVQYAGTPESAPWGEIAGKVWLAHNRSFDILVYDELVRRLGRKLPMWREWHCTADAAAYCGYERSLARASSEILGKTPSKEARTMAKGQEWEDMSRNFQIEMLKYALDDSRYCWMLWAALHERFPEHERQLSWHTSQLARDCLVQADMGLIHTYIEENRARLEKIKNTIPWVVEGFPPTSPKQFHRYCDDAGIPTPDSMAKDSEEFEEWMHEYGVDHPWAQAMCDYRAVNRNLKVLEAIEKSTLT